jgi:DNA invertase Pin-like site-specific DNA recombinase
MLRPMNTTDKPTAVAYYRTSSATNVGADKDSLTRQQAAVRACATARGLEIVHEYYDAAVSGADPVDSRPGFAEMLTYMLGNGARTIIVENASRFARDLIVQETGYHMLKAQGINLIAADAPDSFLSDTPTAVLVRQILGAVTQFEKATLVLKLRGARERKRRATGRCEGRKDWAAVPAEHVEAAKAAYARKASLRAISADLAAKGFLNRSGKPYGSQSIQLMVDRNHANALRTVRRIAKKQTQAAQAAPAPI